MPQVGLKTGAVAVKITLSSEEAEWLTRFLAAPNLYQDKDDDTIRRSLFHAIDSILHP